jgi:hypothetical protein
MGSGFKPLGLTLMRPHFSAKQLSGAIIRTNLDPWGREHLAWIYNRRGGSLAQPEQKGHRYTSERKPCH